MNQKQETKASIHRTGKDSGGHGFMGGGPRGMSLVDKPRDFKRTMARLIAYLKPYWLAIVAVFIFAVASMVFVIVTPKILGNMTNQLVSDYIDIRAYDQIIEKVPKGIPLASGEAILNMMPEAAKSKVPANILDRIKTLDLSKRPEINFDKLFHFAIILLILYILSSVFSYIQGWIMTNISQKVTYKLRKDISEKINRMPLKYFDSRTFGDVLSRVTNDVDTVSQTLNQSLTQIITSITLIIGILIMMLTISWNLTLIALILVPVSFVLIGQIIKRSQHYFKDQQESLGTLNGHVEEMYSGHNVMKVMGGEKRSVAKFSAVNKKLYFSAWRSQFLSGLMFPIVIFIGNLSFVGVSAYGGWLAIKGQLQIGDIQAFIQYVNQFNQPIVQVANIANVLQSTAAAAERVFEFLSEEEETADPEKPIVLARVKGAIDFEKVKFGYSPDKEIIHNFNAKIKPGQLIAIVGPTGAGKTTMVNLLMRFYDIKSGDIKIDGLNISEMKRADVRKLFGMVLQDTWLFNGTVKENITYGKPKATEAEMLEAAKAAHVDHFVHTLPKGYNLEINEEADNISTGEKQLLTIARAMLADPPMLILDEATSSVDTRTEAIIQKAMENLMKGRTSFVIAHRLSTIRNADLILVMNEGNIIEQGTHEELLKKNGFYASLYNAQFSSTS